MPNSSEHDDTQSPAPKGGPPTRAREGTSTTLLSLAALGVVFGDIGTSPLYALKACFSRTYGLNPDQMEVLGVLSLIFWSLLLVISFHAGIVPG